MEYATIVACETKSLMTDFASMIENFSQLTWQEFTKRYNVSLLTSAESAHFRDINNVRFADTCDLSLRNTTITDMPRCLYAPVVYRCEATLNFLQKVSIMGSGAFSISFDCGNLDMAWASLEIGFSSIQSYQKEVHAASFLPVYIDLSWCELYFLSAKFE